MDGCQSATRTVKQTRLLGGSREANKRKLCKAGKGKIGAYQDKPRQRGKNKTFLHNATRVIRTMSPKQLRGEKKDWVF